MRSSARKSGRRGRAYGRTAEIRRELRRLFGWSLAEWARRRGFPPASVYAALKGDDGSRVGRNRLREILRALEEDLRAGERH